MQRGWQRLVSIVLSLAGSISLSCLAGVRSAGAQIVPDRTLGAESSRVTPNVTVNGLPSDRIDGGAVRGVNLFHSFQDFNIGNGRGAYFTNPSGIANILTRVTGSNASNILGTLGVLGNANLFLINPNGIVFGQNARLDLRGSFLGSTASSVVFDNNFEFSATNPQAPPLLTINIPTGLRFRDNPGQILVRGRGQDLGLNGAVKGFDEEIGGLRVEPGRNLTLVGGNVRLDGGILQASEGKVELGGLLTTGTVGLNPDLSLIFPENVVRGNVSLVNRSGINVLGSNGGAIEIKAGNIDISGNSLLTAGIATGLGSVNSQAGDIVLNALGAINIDGSKIENNVNPDATGNGGKIEAIARSLSLVNNAVINSSTYGRGNASIISFQVPLGNIDLNGSNIFSTVENSGVGNSKGIEINSKTLSLRNGAQIQTLVRGKQTESKVPGRGNAGNIEITVSDLAIFESGSGLFSTLGSFTSDYAELGAEGRGGNITIVAGREISFIGGARLLASTFGNGNAGTIFLQAPQGNIKLDGSNIFSTVENSGVGNSGGIVINANSLSLINGASLLTLVRGKQTDNSVPGKGTAGDINITVNDSAIFRSSSQLFSTLGSFNSNNIELGAEGRGGNITIVAGKEISFTGGARLLAETYGKGNAGNIFLQSNSFSLTNGAVISASTYGIGSAGGILISASQGEIKLDGNGTTIFSNVENNGVGNSGGIDIKARSFSAMNNAQIQTLVRGKQTESSVPGKGIAGDIKITVDDRATFESGSIVSSTLGSIRNGIQELGAEGKGGDIIITADREISLNVALFISSTLGIGNAGKISLLAPNGHINLNGNGQTTVRSNVENNGVGNSGGIDINAKTLSLTNGIQLQTLVRGKETDSSTPGRGVAGDIKIAVIESANFDSG